MRFKKKRAAQPEAASEAATTGLALHVLPDLPQFSDDATPLVTEDDQIREQARAKAQQLLSSRDPLLSLDPKYRYAKTPAYTGDRIAEALGLHPVAAAPVGVLTAGDRFEAEGGTEAVTEDLSGLDEVALCLPVLDSVSLFDQMVAEFGMRPVLVPQVARLTVVEDTAEVPVAEVVGESVETDTEPVTETAVETEAGPVAEVVEVDAMDDEDEPVWANTDPEGEPVWVNTAEEEGTEAEKDAYAALIVDLQAFSDMSGAAALPAFVDAEPAPLPPFQPRLAAEG